jgi:AcrR family transcriptional regulator
VAAESGYEAMSATAVVTRAGVSRKTFYDLFADREECFMAALDEALMGMAAAVVPAWEQEGKWSQRLRDALIAALRFLDDEREAGEPVISYLVGCGPKSAELRLQVLELLWDAVEEGCSQETARAQCSPLTAEFVVGGVLAVIHARLRARLPQTMALVNPLMWMIVLPYLGPAAAGRELNRATPKGPASSPARSSDPLRRLNMRLTYRTARVLEVIGGSPGASNVEVGARAGMADPGQISKLLGRLAGLGLIKNTGPGQAVGGANAWRLTSSGEQLEAAIRRKSIVGGR